MLKLENSIRGLSFSRVAFDLTIQGKNRCIFSKSIIITSNILYKILTKSKIRTIFGILPENIALYV